jgi:methylenetetrahydrofolate/methylenetetrahydromethanopterin dehydrogenase (NADP+)
VKKTFFGPFLVSVLFDANGSNTTAAAAVLAASKGNGASLQGARAVVLAATGPVGQRVARLLGRLGASVSVGSRDLARAKALAEHLHETTGGEFAPFDTSREESIRQVLQDAAVIVSAGPAGVRILPAALWQGLKHLKTMIDLSAVPPLGIEGIEATDKDHDRSGVKVWGALGVGGTKMKIHKKAIQQLFTANNLVLDAEEVLELGRGFL